MSEVSSIRVNIPLNVNDEPIGDILRRIADMFDNDDMGFLESAGSQGVSDENDEQLARVDLIYEDQEQLENAAPDLLEALKIAEGSINWIRDNVTNENGLPAIHKNVKAAIAKATD